MELERKIDELGRVVNEFKTAHQKELDEIKKQGTASTETTQKVEKLNEKISSLESEIKGFQVALNRSRQDGQEQKTVSEYKKQFASWMRKGTDISQDAIKEYAEKEFKDMRVQVDEDGGFLVDSETSSEIVKQVFESSPMRELASVQTISTDALEILEDLDEAASGWVGEEETRTSTGTPKLKEIKIPVHELFAKPKATQKLLDDAAINVEAWLAGKVSEKFARDEATAFVSGDGHKKPKGFLSYAEGTGFNQVQVINSGTNGDFDADDMIDLIYALKEAYTKNGSLLMKRDTVKKLRKFKGTDGHYLWAPGLDGRTQSSFLGYPIFEANDMPAVANGAKAVAFGDFKAGYQIVDRIGIRVLRDPYSNKPYVEFYTTKRVGGGVKNFEAIKILKLSA